MSVCPAGHDTAATDYCDVCGIVMPADGADATGTLPVVEPAAPDTAACPHCSAANPPNALFCEACGYDFTTGTLPRPLNPLDVSSPSAPAPAAAAPAADANPAPAPADSWVAEVWIDPDWYADQKSTDPLPSPGLPSVVPLKHTSVLIGRASRSRNITPDIDLSSDNGISRRHAQLTTDGTRWFVEDLGSSNGTYVGGSVGPLPSTPVPPGQKQEIASDDRVYVGAWTRIVVRRATDGEV
ncbi:FHA domain-containing protein [Nocardioides sp. cx-173]|uniref:FHA domain-containing protein n=1 Tax=Nocardioides sp. cx-173 TaxID=2898796 RepID=UPI001E39D0D9|nr:FHA domain-containing protein [Nocardioides sp. cx-173]MCD4524690.1 FHA domain-containing protein [Nocardioides sp. cx-173]UGB43200.1 FHA domain-containing protein [Nocardioides sp. cx-173]